MAMKFQSINVRNNVQLTTFHHKWSYPNGLAYTYIYLQCTINSRLFNYSFIHNIQSVCSTLINSQWTNTHHIYIIQWIWKENNQEQVFPLPWLQVTLTNLISIYDDLQGFIKEEMPKESAQRPKGSSKQERISKFEVYSSFQVGAPWGVPPSTLDHPIRLGCPGHQDPISQPCWRLGRPWLGSTSHKQRHHHQLQISPSITPKPSRIQSRFDLGLLSTLFIKQKPYKLIYKIETQDSWIFLKAF